MNLKNYLEAKAFKPDYDKCDKIVKGKPMVDVYFGLCVNEMKDTITKCRLKGKNDKECGAWKGYTDGMKIDNKNKERAEGYK